MIAASLMMVSCGVSKAALRNGPNVWEQTGQASWYREQQAGRKTASGAEFRPNAMTAAHRTLPFGTIIRVTDVKSGKSILVTVTDRGPFAVVHRNNHTRFVPHPTRITDLTEGAAKRLGLIKGCKSRNCEPGIINVRIQVVSQTRYTSTFSDSDMNFPEKTYMKTSK